MGQNQAANVARPERPILPLADPPLDREALLLAVARAASAAALREDDSETQRELDGDRFELRLRFGCTGPAGGAQTERRIWSFDEKQRILRVRVEPDISATSPSVEKLAGQRFEAVEGFWIGRPWLLAAGCPVPELEPEQAGQDRGQKPVIEGNSGTVLAPVPRIGIAQFFTNLESRTQRRDDRAYEATKTLATDNAPSSAGYDLVLSGRLSRLPQRRVIACASSGIDVPPACIISATFDRVRVEHPGTHEIVASWGGG